MENLAIVCAFDPKTAYGYSHYLVAREIQRVIGGKVYNFQDKKIPEKNILFVGTCTANVLTYLTRFLPRKNVVLYATVEGFPIILPKSVEREVAKRIKIVAVSEYVKMWIETSQLHCDGVVYHGINMKNRKYDKFFLEYLTESWTKGRQIVLAVIGNMPRKGVDKFMLTSKLVQAQKDVCFILHSGGGPPPAIDVRRLSEQLQLNDFWFTNSFAMYSPEKMNALYYGCTVYVQPSLCEGFGRPMIEAMRFFKPVVAVDAQPYSEIVENGKTGILVPCLRVEGVNWMDQIQMNLHLYSVNDVADAILKLLEGKKSIKMKKAIAGQSEKFESTMVYPQLSTYFES